MYTDLLTRSSCLCIAGGMYGWYNRVIKGGRSGFLHTYLAELFYSILLFLDRSLFGVTSHWILEQVLGSQTTERSLETNLA